MKRGVVGEAEKHVIRRKIDEKLVMIREQRKVRERLSRECADTMRHIAATKAAIQTIKARHEEKLKDQKEEFVYGSAAELREVRQQEEKRAELERILSSSELIEREQRVLSERLASLRVDDENEETENAREMDALKRNLFNVRNELEKAFRTTLHDLNVAYQEQAFDVMVQEATVARSELPSLRKELYNNTRDVNKIIVQQAGSFAGSGQAKILRDVARAAVRIQGKRTAKLRREVEDRKEEAARVETELKTLGDNFEDFQVRAEEMRTAAAELRCLQAESARKQQECLKVQSWVHKLAKQGPRALKSEKKRQRLAAATSAAMASFLISSRTNTGCPALDTGIRTDCGETSSSSKPTTTAPDNRNKNVEIYREGGRDLMSSPVPSPPPHAVRSESGGQTTNCNSADSLEIDSRNTDSPDTDGQTTGRHYMSNGTIVRDSLVTRAGGARALAAERRSTDSLVTGMAFEGLGMDVEGDGRNDFLLGRSTGRDEKKRVRVQSTLARSGSTDSVAPDSDGKRTERGHGVHSPVNEAASEECVWRASLSDLRRRQHEIVSIDDEDRREPRPTAAFAGPTTKLHKDSKCSILLAEEAAVGSKKKSLSVERGRVTADDGGGRGQGDDVREAQGNLTPEVLADILLSEANAVGDKAYEKVLNRARQWGGSSPAMVVDTHPREEEGNEECVGGDHSRWEAKKSERPLLLQPFPDLPYGFTDIGRRLNVENHGGSNAPEKSTHRD